MKRLTMEPRTPAWYEVRDESWTASMAATLVAKENATLLQSHAAAKGIVLDIDPLLEVGLDEFFENTLWTAWAQKNGRIPRFKGNAHTERGQTNEERVLQHFEQAHLIMAEREVTALSSTEGWLLASFDALVPASSDPAAGAPHGFPVEAKCPAFGSRKKLWDAKKAGRLAIMGLPYYWCQVQHQMLVADAPYAWFVAAGVEPNKTTGKEEVVFPIIEKVPRDERFLAAYLAAAKYYFTEFIDAYVEPPLLARDRAMLASLEELARMHRALAVGEVDTAVELYLQSVKEEAAAAQRRKELEALVLASAQAMRAEGEDVVILADRLEVQYGMGSTVSWQQVAKTLAVQAGLKEVPEEVLAACTKQKERAPKLKELE